VQVAACRRPPQAVSLSELSGMEGDVITMQEIFRFRKPAFGRRHGPGRFEASGIRPASSSRSWRMA
jgi:pilus assembly protein CpaF